MSTPAPTWEDCAQAAQEAPAYLRPAEAAELLRISKATLEKWRTQGRGPRVLRFGSRVLYALTDLHAWAQQQGPQVGEAS